MGSQTQVALDSRAHCAQVSEDMNWANLLINVPKRVESALVVISLKEGASSGRNSHIGNYNYEVNTKT